MYCYKHISFDTVDRFIPRVPANRCIGEDAETKRISVGTELLAMTEALPSWLIVLGRSFEVMGRAVLHVYSLYTDEPAYRPTIEQVPDSKRTGELWLLKEPIRVTVEDIIVTSIEVDYSPIRARLVAMQYHKSALPADNYAFLVESFTGYPDPLRVKKLKEIPYPFPVIMANWDRKWTQALQDLKKTDGGTENHSPHRKEKKNGQCI